MISPSIAEQSNLTIPKLAEMGSETRLFEPAQATQDDWIAFTKKNNYLQRTRRITKIHLFFVSFVTSWIV